jgi:hypothetical protein
MSSQAFQRTSCERVRETTVEVQIGLGNLKLFDSVVQEQYREFTCKRLTPQSQLPLLQNNQKERDLHKQKHRAHNHQQDLTDPNSLGAKQKLNYEDQIARHKTRSRRKSAAKRNGPSPCARGWRNGAAETIAWSRICTGES